jgi:hypothetical protein
VFINAWETDFASEPLAPIISELADKFSDQLKPEDRRWEKAKKLAAKVAAASVPIGVKLITAGILDSKDLAEASAVGDAAQKLAEKQFQHFTAAKKSIHGLRSELTKLTAHIRNGRLSSSESNENKRNSPVVVFMDELDRCRPSYAIEVLEVLKHFFDIPGIVFVLAIDRGQLVSAAKAVFGTGLDGDGYLRRFIDLECSLPDPNIQNIFFKLATSDRSIMDWREHAVALESIGRLCLGAKFSLRKIYQFIARASIAAVTANAVAAEAHEVLFFVFLREYDQQLYDDFVRRKLTCWSVLMKLRELDPQFGCPSGERIPFVHLLAALGNDDAPKPFIDLLEEDYQSKQIKFDGFSWLRQTIRGGYGVEGHLRRLTPCIDFCVTFVT